MRSLFLSLFLCLLSVTTVAQEKAPAADGQSRTYVCPAGQPCNMTIKVKADCKNCKKPTEVVNRHFNMGVRLQGELSGIPGLEDGERDWMKSGDVWLDFQFMKFLGSVGVEFAIGSGGAYYPGGNAVLFSGVEAGPLLELSNHVQLFTGYRGNIGVTTNDVAFQRHAVVARPRVFLLKNLAVEVPVTVGWGAQLWKTQRDIYDGENWFRETTTQNLTGLTWSAGVSTLLTW